MSNKTIPNLPQSLSIKENLRKNKKIAESIPFRNLPSFFNVTNLECEIVQNVMDMIHYGKLMERKSQVYRLQNLGKIEVYSDHNPPHFHITGEKINLKFDLHTLNQLSGELINSKQAKDLKKWYFERGGKSKLLFMWNQRNPDNQARYPKI